MNVPVAVGANDQSSRYMLIVIGGFATTLGVALAVHSLIARTIPGLRGVGRLGWGLMCGLISTLLLATQSFIPAWLSMVASNELFFLASLLLLWAAADILAVKTRLLPWGIGLLVVAFAIHVYFTYLSPSLTARIMNHCLVSGAYAAATAVLLFGYQHRHAAPAGQAPALQFSTAVLAWVSALTAAADLVRTLLTFRYPPGNLNHIDMLQVGFAYTSMLLKISAVCGLIWISVCIHRWELQIAAQTDSLSGLLNRRAFEEILSREMRQARHTAESVVLLLLDIDRFKAINDTWGHPAGDEVIRRVSGILQQGLRPIDALFRVGGEEFAALLRKVPLPQAQQIAERLREEVANLTGLPGAASITISVGVAQSYPGETAEELVRRSDAALYGSKNRGRNLVTLSEKPLCPDGNSLALLAER